MDNKDLINTIYDILAQNKVSKLDVDYITNAINYVDTENNYIELINGRGVILRLQLIKE